MDDEYRPRDVLKVVTNTKFKAKIDDIILDETDRVSMRLEATLVNNPEEKKSINGTLIYERKWDNGDWNRDEVSKKDVLKGKVLKINLGADELYHLFRGLCDYYRLYDENKFSYGTTKYVRCAFEKNIFKEILTSHIPTPNEKNRLSMASKMIDCIFNNDIQIEDFQNILELLDFEKLNELHHKMNISNLLIVEKKITENINNPNEKCWQKFFLKHDWVLSQLFPQPLVFFESEAYTGGKTIENKNGGLCDFIYKHHMTDNVSLIEIKNPCTELMGDEYRKGVFNISGDLTGSINQVLKYKNDLDMEYYSLVAKQEGKNFRVFSPRCVVLAGKISNLNSMEKKRSFEYFRNECATVSIITFDELLEKIKALIKIFSKTL